MSQFYGEIQGGRGSATRTGTKSSGLWGHIRGRQVGAYVRIEQDADGKDHVYVYRTGGSGNPSTRELVADFTA
jgi:hypothetical protein